MQERMRKKEREREQKDRMKRQKLNQAREMRMKRKESDYQEIKKIFREDYIERRYVSDDQ